VKPFDALVKYDRWKLLLAVMIAANAAVLAWGIYLLCQ